jgi:hypothetical protein
MATRTVISFMINALIIFSTTHAQDFRDEVGDKLIGRRTIPIVWPKGSHVGIFVMLIAWSVGLSWAFGLASFFLGAFLHVGSPHRPALLAKADTSGKTYFDNLE